MLSLKLIILCFSTYAEWVSKGIHVGASAVLLHNAFKVSGALWWENHSDRDDVRRDITHQSITVWRGWACWVIEPITVGEASYILCTQIWWSVRIELSLGSEVGHMVLKGIPKKVLKEWLQRGRWILVPGSLRTKQRRTSYTVLRLVVCAKATWYPNYLYHYYFSVHPLLNVNGCLLYSPHTGRRQESCEDTWDVDTAVLVSE